MVRDFSKLMLRAYNAEADNLVRHLMRPYKLACSRSARRRSTSDHRQARQDDGHPDLGRYHMAVREFELTADYLEVEEEKERDRAERERQREEEEARQEFERERRGWLKEQTALPDRAGSSQPGRPRRPAALAPTGQRSPPPSRSRAPRGQHPRRLCLRDLQHRLLRRGHGQDRHDPSPGADGPRTGARRRLGPVPLRRPRPDLQRDAVGLETRLHHGSRDATCEPRQPSARSSTPLPLRCARSSRNWAISMFSNFTRSRRHRNGSQ